ncbi:hypothetical protein PF006_g17488 [Phytophthora fragariae]|uniref:Uncharacterized protein n=1 Tax=Phytophthora fragariae TaxID=53985 RepID=A0A6A3ST09_9STRA|nr:hypothetical protein PF011_g20316 [Phytophthora fragariae]KAE9123120.1 hypothetical protein PF006_g17488 [Phytophthora fragariae]
MRTIPEADRDANVIALRVLDGISIRRITRGFWVLSDHWPQRFWAKEARDSSRRLYTARRPLCMELNGEGDKEVQFFLDPYSRPKEKNGGAWMNTCLHRSRLLSPKEKGGKRIQVAYIMCSQSQRLIWLPFGQQRKRVLVR